MMTPARIFGFCNSNLANLAKKIANLIIKPAPYKGTNNFQIIDRNWTALQYITNQTSELCWFAVERNWGALRYVRADMQTPELCLFAVTQNGHALEYVRNQTEAICWAAIKETPAAIKYVHEQTPALCLLAVSWGRGATKRRRSALHLIRDLDTADRILLAQLGARTP